MSTEDELDVLREVLTRAAEVIGAQTFDVKTLAKCRRAVLVELAADLLAAAEGRPIRPARYVDPDDVRRRFPELDQP